jgi:hypothetical protein
MANGEQQQAPQPGQEQADQRPVGDATQTVADINTGLSQLGQMLQDAGVQGPVVEQFQQTMQSFQSLVDTLGGAQAQPPAPQGPQPAQGSASPEAGAANVRQAL